MTPTFPFQKMRPRKLKGYRQSVVVQAVPGSNRSESPMFLVMLSCCPFQISHILARNPTIGSPVNKRSKMGGRMFRHMIDVWFTNRERGGIGVHGVLKGGVIKGEGLTGFSVVQIKVCRRIWGVGSPVGVSVGGVSG